MTATTSGGGSLTLTVVSRDENRIRVPEDRGDIGMPGGHPHAQILAEEDRLLGASRRIVRIRVLLHFR
ncbi:MAG: hypothetical protein QM820_26925 [Minicystis sp.]